MDYGALNQSGWAQYLPIFKNVFRPSFVSGSVGLGEFESCDAAITQARADSSIFGDLGDRLINLVFDGYRDWYQSEDSWVLQEIVQVLDDSGDQQNSLINGLYAIGSGTDDEARKSALLSLAVIAEQFMNLWQQEAAADGYTRAEVVEQAAVIEGTPNTDNWQASRTPGTFYYAYVDGRYLYSDVAEGPIEEWETLPEREQLASELAQEWGAGFCTPTGGNPDYGADYVFALSKEGPWLMQSEVEAAMATAAPASPEAVVVQQWGEERATKLDELFAELAALGWSAEEAEYNDSMPTMEEIIERFDSRVDSGIAS